MGSQMNEGCNNMFFDLTVPKKVSSQESSSEPIQDTRTIKPPSKLSNYYQNQELIDEEDANKIYKCNHSSSPTIVTSSGRFTFTYQEKQQSEIEINKNNRVIKITKIAQPKRPNNNIANQRRFSVEIYFPTKNDQISSSMGYDELIDIF